MQLMALLLAILAPEIMAQIPPQLAQDVQRYIANSDVWLSTAFSLTFRQKSLKGVIDVKEDSACLQHLRYSYDLLKKVAAVLADNSRASNKNDEEAQALRVLVSQPNIKDAICREAKSDPNVHDLAVRANVATPVEIQATPVPPPPAAQQCAQTNMAEHARARVEAEKERVRREIQEAEAEAASIKNQEEADCFGHTTCPECRAAGCAWCLGPRACVDDVKWACSGGQDDHVGNIGTVKECPSPEALAQRRAERLREEREAAEEEARARAAMENADKLGKTCAFRRTDGCAVGGTRRPHDDLECNSTVPSDVAGFCECVGMQLQIDPVACGHPAFRCDEVCSASRQAATLAAERRKRRNEEELDRMREQATATARDDETEAERKERHDEIFKRVEWAKRTGQDKPTPYDVMGLDSKSTQSEIRRAYRRLSLRLHPDKNVDIAEDAQLVFAELVAAYEILMNPSKRAAFDDFGGDDETFETAWEYQQYSPP